MDIKQKDFDYLKNLLYDYPFEEDKKNNLTDDDVYMLIYEILAFGRMFYNHKYIKRLYDIWNGFDDFAKTIQIYHDLSKQCYIVIYKDINDLFDDCTKFNNRYIDILKDILLGGVLFDNLDDAKLHVKNFVLTNFEDYIGNVEEVNKMLDI